MSHDKVSASGRAPATDEPSLRSALEADSVRERRDAAVGLVDVASDGLGDETVAELADRVRSDPDSTVRQFAVEALGVAGEELATIREGLSDQEPWVRAEAIVAYSRAKPDDRETLRACLDDESGPVRRNAVIALGKSGAVGQSVLVDRLRSDGHPPVREYAAQYLGEQATDVDEAVRILAAVLAREPNAFVRAKAASSLGELGTDHAKEALESQGLRDRSDTVTRAAKLAIASAEGRDPESIDIPESTAPGGGPDRSHEPPAGASEAQPSSDATGFGGEPR